MDPTIDLDQVEQTEDTTPSVDLDPTIKSAEAMSLANAIDEKVEKELKRINMEQTAVDSLIKSILPFIDRSKVSDMML